MTTTTQRGVKGLRCFGCGESDTLCVRIDDGDLLCESCEQEFTVQTLHQQAAILLTLARWIEAIPTLELDS